MSDSERIEAAAAALEREWARVTECCFFSELSASKQEFWRPVIRRWAVEALAAADGVRDTLPELENGWYYERGVTCVVAPCCAFTFDAVHTDEPGGGYSCPMCDGVCDPGPAPTLNSDDDYSRLPTNRYGVRWMPTWPHVSLGISVHFGWKFGHVSLHLPVGVLILGFVGASGETNQP